MHVYVVVYELSGSTLAETYVHKDRASTRQKALILFGIDAKLIDTLMIQV